METEEQNGADRRENVSCENIKNAPLGFLNTDHDECVIVHLSIYYCVGAQCLLNNILIKAVFRSFHPRAQTQAFISTQFSCAVYLCT